jgi:hypothetical protein
VDARRGAYFVGTFTVAAGPLASGDSLVQAMTPTSMSQAEDIGQLLRAGPGQAGTPTASPLTDPGGSRPPPSDPPLLAVGDGANSFLETAEDCAGTSFRRGPSDWDTPRASVLGFLTAQRLLSARFDLEAIHKLEPCYLRVSEAEMRFLRRGPA